MLQGIRPVFKFNVVLVSSYLIKRGENMFKKIITAVLATLMLLIVLPTKVLAENGTISSTDESTQNELSEIDFYLLNSEEKEFVNKVCIIENINRDSTSLKIYKDNLNNIFIYHYVSDSKVDIYNYTSTMREYELPTDRGIITTLIGIYLLYETIETYTGRVSKACAVIQFVSGFDGCSYLLHTVLDSLVYAQRKKYKVIRYLYKDPDCPYPPHSAACNQLPYAYWKTSVEVY